MYLTPPGLFQVPLPVNTCIPLKPRVEYSYPLAEAFIRNLVFAAPTLVSPVPPLLTARLPVTTLEFKFTALAANFPEVTAPSCMLLADTVVGAIFVPVIVLSANDVSIKFFKIKI